MRNQQELMIDALSKLAPSFKWEHIETGGGCTALLGQSQHHKDRAIMITDGSAEAPEFFGDVATAIYWENHRGNVYRMAKPWTDVKPFWEMIIEMARDIAAWAEEETPLESLICRLAEWAGDLENGAITYLAGASRASFIEDLKTATHLLRTHATEA
jgi:hypothetical protein